MVVAHLMNDSLSCIISLLLSNNFDQILSFFVLDVNSFPGLWDYLELDMRAQRLWVAVGGH